jgi:hypothetical protein
MKDTPLAEDTPGLVKVYQFERYGLTTYTVKTPPGLYRVILHFAETWHRQAGKRVFDVTLNGRTVIEDLDVFQAADGRPLAAVVHEAQTTSYGQITIGFKGKVGMPLINGIEIIQVTREN